MPEYEVIDCTLEEHGDAILEILNDAIATSTALYDYEPRPRSSMDTWFATKTAGNFPVIGVVDEAGKLLGFGSFGAFRAYPAYKYTVEHSVYVHKDARGQGIGRVLVEYLIDEARDRQLHAIIGAIDAGNIASISLHDSLGFEKVGVLPQVGFKFGKWLDLAFMQLILETPEEPQDG
jgi:phosphinothricin acetyltransferase